MFYYSHPQPGMCAPGPSHVLLIETKTPVQCSAVRPCTSLHIASIDFEHRKFYCVRTGYDVMESSQFCLKPESVNGKWQ